MKKDIFSLYFSQINIQAHYAFVWSIFTFFFFLIALGRILQGKNHSQEILLHRCFSEAKQNQEEGKCVSLSLAIAYLSIYDFFSPFIIDWRNKERFPHFLRSFIFHGIPIFIS